MSINPQVDHVDDGEPAASQEHVDWHRPASGGCLASSRPLPDGVMARHAEHAVARVREDGRRSLTRGRQLKRARAMLHARYFEPITLTDLAVTACMSVHHFSRQYAQAFGKSASAEMLELRLALADYLLAETALGIAQVAKASGFGCRTTMFRQFVRHRGKAPEEVRIEHRKWQRALRIRPRGVAGKPPGMTRMKASPAANDAVIGGEDRA